MIIDWENFLIFIRVVVEEPQLTAELHGDISFLSSKITSGLFRSSKQSLDYKVLEILNYKIFT